MSISLFKPKPSADRPAAADLAAIKERIAALSAEDERWGSKETGAGHDVRRHEEAHQLLARLEERCINAQADREVRGTSADDPLVLEAQISEQRAFVQRLAERRRLADAVLVRIRAERQRIRAEMISCQQQLPAALHAVIREHLRALAPEFLRAEQAYLAALAKVYGAAHLADQIAEAHRVNGIHLGWIGRLNAGDIYTPRPAGIEAAAFEPVPQRPDIAAAIQAEALALEKSL